MTQPTRRVTVIDVTTIDRDTELWDAFDRADNDNRTAKPPKPRQTPAQLMEEMRNGIARMHDEAAAREKERIAQELSDLVVHPDAPHPNAVWRERSRKVYRRMREHLCCENAPWHHREIWEWAASTAAGVEYLEREIEYWERRTTNSIARQRFHRERAKQRRIEGKPIDILDVEL